MTTISPLLKSRLESNKSLEHKYHTIPTDIKPNEPKAKLIKENFLQSAVSSVGDVFQDGKNFFKAAKTGKYAAIITLGAVIKGSTGHYDYVCAEVSKGVASVSLETGVPVIFGVLTTDNIEQAIERAGTKAGNKGSDAAKSAIEMANLLKLV